MNRLEMPFCGRNSRHISGDLAFATLCVFYTLITQRLMRPSPSTPCLLDNCRQAGNPVLCFPNVPSATHISLSKRTAAGSNGRAVFSLPRLCATALLKNLPLHHRGDECLLRVECRHSRNTGQSEPTRWSISLRVARQPAAKSRVSQTRNRRAL